MSLYLHYLAIPETNVLDYMPDWFDEMAGHGGDDECSATFCWPDNGATHCSDITQAEMQYELDSGNIAELLLDEELRSIDEVRADLAGLGADLE